MGPFYNYRDSNHLLELIKKLEDSGIKICENINQNYTCYDIHKGLGYVVAIIGYYETKDSLYLAYGHTNNPFLWYHDGKLLKTIQDVLESNGSEMIFPESIYPKEK